MNEFLKTMTQTRIYDRLVGKGLDVNNRFEKIKDPLIADKPPGWDDSWYQSEFYKKIGLDIVTETVFDYPYPFITEKTVRPIAAKRFFIVVGAPKTLAMLHDNGFKTFDHFIDESYDLELDPVKRFLMIEKEIIKFCGLDISEVQVLLNQNKDILDHNFQTLTELEDKEITQLIETLG